MQPTATKPFKRFDQLTTSFLNNVAKQRCDKLSGLTDRVISWVDIFFHIRNSSKSCLYCEPIWSKYFYFEYFLCLLFLNFEIITCTTFKNKLTILQYVRYKIFLTCYKHNRILTSIRSRNIFIQTTCGIVRLWAFCYYLVRSTIYNWLQSIFHK